MIGEQVGVADVLQAFGAGESNRVWISKILDTEPLLYRRFGQEERKHIIAHVKQNFAKFARAGAHRHDIWSSSWQEVAERYHTRGRDTMALEPVFIDRQSTIRYAGDYAQALTPRFEFSWFRLLRDWLFSTWIAPLPRVYEFGCGSGYNLVALARRYPDKELIGLDWAESAVALVKQVANDHGLPIKSRRFDFFSPDPALRLEPGSGVITFCALEQTGARGIEFVDWLRDQRPGVVVHMEPIEEFYNSQDEFDSIALSYHRRRNYLNAYLTYLRRLEAGGRLSILHAKRTGLGSLYHEGYSVVVWRPTL